MGIYHLTEKEQIKINESLSETFEIEFISIDYTPIIIETVPFRSSESQSRPGKQNGMYGYDWGDRHPKSMLGKTHSEKTKAKMSQNNGRYWKDKSIPEDIKAKMSKAKIGKKASDETKCKMSKSRTGKVRSEETKRKMSEAATLRWAKIKNHQSHQEVIDIDVELDS